MKPIFVSFGLLLFFSLSVMAQERANSIVVQAGGQGQVQQVQGAGAWQQSYYLPGHWALAQESVRKEIDLVPEQEQKLQALSKEYMTKMNEMYAPLRDLKMSPEERTEKYKESQEKLKALTESTTKQVNEILLPHQQKTLERIDLRQKAAMMLQYGPYVDKLNLTEEAKEKIKKKRDALNEAVAKMQRETFVFVRTKPPPIGP